MAARSESTVASGVADDELPPPTLQGILCEGGRRVAWIDGRAWHEGEEIRGHRVVRIDSDRVVVMRGPDRIELRQGATD